MLKFKHVECSTGSDDGLWMARIDAYTMAVIEFAYWEELDSSAVETYGNYNIQAGTVDLLSDDLPSALLDCGYLIEAATGNIVKAYDNAVVAEHGSKTFTLCVASCLWRYGAKDVLEDSSGNNRRKLFRSARANF